MFLWRSSFPDSLLFPLSFNLFLFFYFQLPIFFFFHQRVNLFNHLDIVLKLSLHAIWPLYLPLLHKPLWWNLWFMIYKNPWSGPGNQTYPRNTLGNKPFLFLFWYEALVPGVYLGTNVSTLLGKATFSKITVTTIGADSMAAMGSQAPILNILWVRIKYRCADNILCKRLAMCSESRWVTVNFCETQKWMQLRMFARRVKKLSLRSALWSKRTKPQSQRSSAPDSPSLYCGATSQKINNKIKHNLYFYWREQWSE